MIATIAIETNPTILAINATKDATGGMSVADTTKAGAGLTHKVTTNDTGADFQTKDSMAWYPNCARPISIQTN